MKTKLFALVFLAGSTMIAGPRVFVSVGFGGGYHPYYAPARVYAPAPVYYAPAPVAYAPAPVAVYGAPPVAPPVGYGYAVPAAPGYGYTWVGGYYYPAGRSWGWHAGAWVRPPYARAAWVAPRYAGGRYYAGYWRR
jgi:hypothetical protein